MKKWIAAYIQFNRAERLGFITLGVLLLLLFCCRATMHLWVKPDLNPEKEAMLARAWEDFNAARINPPMDEILPPKLFFFDPNTLDSAGWRALGLTEKTTRLLLNWRRKGKVFYKKEDLKAVYTLADATYRRLEPYIRIQQDHGRPGEERLAEKRQKNAAIDLNTADSATLVRLWGVGPALARKITERRKALGGFIEHEQLLEIYPFKDTVLSVLRHRLLIDPGKLIRININTADPEMLSAHPYIGPQIAAGIISLRNELGNYKNIKELKQVPLINEENYRKIAPYLTVE
jgi:competence protein ComEA